MRQDDLWDVVVVGAGPAGLSAARTAATAGARTLILERATHPRYKTCGGGLIGASLAALPDGFELPARDRTHQVSFTHNGRRRITRHEDRPVLAMVNRAEFDAALCRAATDAGAHLRQQQTVRAITGDAAGSGGRGAGDRSDNEGQDRPGDAAQIRLADGTLVRARAVIGSDGSSGVTARHVGVRFDQADLGLELEIPVPAPVRREWAGRLLIDWGPIPGSYGWVFPKGDTLTVGVIAEKGFPGPTRRYLRDFVDRLGLAGMEPRHDSGHLTRCRTADSPLRRGRVLVAGDAAGLLEPWTREGISFALRSGTLAGRFAALAAQAPTAAEADAALDGYPAAVEETLGVEMAAGRRLFTAYRRHPGPFHGALSTPAGWRLFTRFCRGDDNLDTATRSWPIRATVAALSRW